MNIKVLFIIAAYNEEKSIGSVIDNLLKANQNVLVVNDGSKDTTLELLLGFGDKIYVANHPTNMGQGSALQTGIECARLLNPEFIVTYDADGQHRLEDALDMITKLEKNSKIEILLGSRFLGKAENIPFMKVLTLKFAILFTKIFSGISLTDVHNGLRVLRKSFYQRFNFHQPGMEHASEILDFIALNKIIFQEHPVTISYTEYSLSKGQSWTNSFKLAIKLLGDKF